MKKILAMIIAAMMLVSIIPLTTMAAEVDMTSMWYLATGTTTVPESTDAAVLASGETYNSNITGILWKYIKLSDTENCLYFYVDNSVVTTPDPKWSVGTWCDLQNAGSGARTYGANDSRIYSQYLDNVSKVIIEEGINTVGDFAFYQYKVHNPAQTVNATTSSSLDWTVPATYKKLYLPSTLTEIGYANFGTDAQSRSANGATNALEYVYFAGKNLASIDSTDMNGKKGPAVFAWANNIQGVYVHKDSTTYNTVYNFANVTTNTNGITIKNKIKAYEDHIAYDNGTLTVYSNSGITDTTVFSHIADANASNVTKLVIAGTTTTTGRTFDPKASTNRGVKFENIEEIVVGGNQETIGTKEFKELSKLKTLTLGSQVKTISDQAFYMTGLEEIVIPEAVTTIGEYAFQDNHSLKKVKFEHKGTIGLPEDENATLKINASAFYACGRKTDGASVEFSGWLGTGLDKVYHALTTSNGIAFDRTLVWLDNIAFDDSANKIIVTTNTALKTAKIIVAGYVGDVLVDVDVCPEGTSSEYEFDISGATSYKAFAFESFDTLKPLVAAAEK